MRERVAVDAGGTSSRAVVVDGSGRCLGFGRAGGGNPTARGADDAAAAVVSAVDAALRHAEVPSGDVSAVLVAHAGVDAPAYRAALAAGLGRLGVRATVSHAGDLLALFASGTPEPEGAALIAGTGAIGGAIGDGELVRLVDGTGWLLGDAGSGFWIGHRVARAVVDDLDGGPTTALTPALLERLDLQDDRAVLRGRPAVLGRLVERLYEDRPVALARFAPLAFALAERDGIARAVVAECVTALTALLHRVRAAAPRGPLVLGGSVLVEGVLHLPAPLVAPFLAGAGGGQVLRAADGLTGAAVLALRADGAVVDRAVHARIAAAVDAARVGP